jgi:threonine dehydratase
MPVRRRLRKHKYAEVAVDFTIPSLIDVLDARRRIGPHLARTPLYRYAPLDELMGCEVWVKHENHQPVGAFKVRGGINYIAALSPEERARGVVTASTGNHGQSVAFAGRAFGVQVTICVPQGANPGKDIHSANEPLLIAGVGTYTLEMLEDQPQLDAVVVTVGLGSGACGVCVVAKSLNPRIQVIAVQAEASPAVHASWRSGRIESRPNLTFAEGLSTGQAAELTLEILRRHLDAFELMSEDEIRRGMRWYVEHCHTLAESAAGAALACTWRLRERLRGRKVGVVCSGGNTSVAHLLEALRI